MEKKTQRDSDRINQFQQKKLAEQLAIGMAVRNATLEQLGHKVKEEEIITVSAKAAGEEAAAWAAKSAEQKQQYPSRTLCYSVSVALQGRVQAPPIIKIQQQANRAISNRDVEQLCALIREERAEELARACMSRNASRQRRAVAVLKRALTKK